ncbi:MAG: SAM-dependent methyltransferase [Frankiales bacterium]|nr:SAM-dependent methyltransferase [Frankiales bacterium]
MANADELKAAQAASFGAAAAQYERARPTYPAEAVDWLLPAGQRKVLDLGAGTGKLTRALVERGMDVVAVEPSSGMREQLHRAVPNVRALAGTAEQIPLPDGSVDAVLVGQAWHWVDPARAVPEVARVLAPGGRLGLLWNIRDVSVDWVAELGEILHESATEQDLKSEHPQVGPPFGPIERFDVMWEQPLSRAAVQDLVASRSYVITLAAAERAMLLARVAALLDSHPALSGQELIRIPYIARCSRADLPR